MLGERLISGAVSTALSLGVVLVLASISSGGGVRDAVRPSLATFELGPVGRSVEAWQQQPDRAVMPPAPSEPPLTDPGHQKVPELGKIPTVLPETAGQGGSPMELVVASVARAMEMPREAALATPAVQLTRNSPAPDQVASTRFDAKAQPAAGGAGSGGYKAEVWRHLLQYRRPNAVGPGAALVSFSIGDNGSVADVGIARSSGSKRFDAEAMQMVRRAQPFPKPPSGVAMAFIFEIKGN